MPGGGPLRTGRKGHGGTPGQGEKPSPLASTGWFPFIWCFDPRSTALEQTCFILRNLAQRVHLCLRLTFCVLLSFSVPLSEFMAKLRLMGGRFFFATFLSCSFTATFGVFQTYYFVVPEKASLFRPPQPPLDYAFNGIAFIVGMGVSIPLPLARGMPNVSLLDC